MAVAVAARSGLSYMALNGWEHHLICSNSPLSSGPSSSSAADASMNPHIGRVERTRGRGAGWSRIVFQWRERLGNRQIRRSLAYSPVPRSSHWSCVSWTGT